MIVPSWHTLLLGPDLLNKCTWPINVEIKPRSWEHSPVGTWAMEPDRDGGHGEGAKGGERVCVLVLLPKTGEGVCIPTLYQKIGKRGFLLILFPKIWIKGFFCQFYSQRLEKGFVSQVYTQRLGEDSLPTSTPRSRVSGCLWIFLCFFPSFPPSSIPVAAGDRGMALPSCPCDPGQWEDSRMS